MSQEQNFVVKKCTRRDFLGQWAIGGVSILASGCRQQLSREVQNSQKAPTIQQNQDRLAAQQFIDAYQQEYLRSKNGQVLEKLVNLNLSVAVTDEPVEITVASVPFYLYDFPDAYGSIKPNRDKKGQITSELKSLDLNEQLPGLYRTFLVGHELKTKKIRGIWGWHKTDDPGWTSKESYWEFFPVYINGRFVVSFNKNSVFTSRISGEELFNRSNPPVIITQARPANYQ